MVRSVFAGILSFCFLQVVPGQQTAPEEKKLSLLFIGDIMGHDEQIWSAENRETHAYDYNEVFKYVKPLIDEADISIANLEVTLAGPPYRGYPQFSSPAALAAACKKAGIDCFVTANNHASDRGISGIEKTIFRLDSIGMPHTGTFTDQVAANRLHPLVLRKNGFSLALLNYTYGTNGIKVSPPAIVNMLEKESVAHDIKKAQSIKPDLIVLFLHWGTEYDTVPSKSQAELARYFMSRGADLIIGSHPHVIQKMLWMKDDSLLRNKAVAYSLGNFVSNQRKPKTDGGTMVRIELSKQNNEIKIISAGYYLTWVYTPIVNYRKRFLILPCSQYETRPDFFDSPLSFYQMKSFTTNSRMLLNNQNIGFREIIFNGNSWILSQMN